VVVNGRPMVVVVVVHGEKVKPLASCFECTQIRMANQLEKLFYTRET
jgi:hypothetical protein